MPYFLHQVSYTPEALARLIANPQDRFEAVRAPIEKLGGKVHGQRFRRRDRPGLRRRRFPAQLPDHGAHVQRRGLGSDAQGRDLRL